MNWWIVHSNCKIFIIWMDVVVVSSTWISSKDSSLTNLGGKLFRSFRSFIQFESWTVEKLSCRKAVRIMNAIEVTLTSWIRRFELHYYTCAGCYLSMTIDNRTQDNSDSMTTMHPGSSSNGNSGNGTRDDIVATPLERLIHTKWAEAKISMKGPPPASLSY